MPLPATLFAIGCMLAAAGLVVAELRHWRTTRVACKVAGSTLFVLVAVSLDAATSQYGQLVVVALLLSWLGDVCLLSAQSTFFRAGLAFFLLAHVAYSVAFAGGDLSPSALGVALAAMSVVGALTQRWLWAHLGAFDRAAVSAYVLAIVAMCALAVARGVAMRSWPVAVGALAFMASDISVARDRFVAPGPLNRAWGLPLYYAAQLLLAWSVL